MGTPTRQTKERKAHGIGHQKINARTGDLEAGIKTAVEAAEKGDDVTLTYDFAGRALSTDVSAGDTALDVRRRLFS
ncbi:hypothetical protein E1281_32475 [Actinomadura sp. KC345]|uniref:hypothetical protein n=1 Tax=Actinomadura sp. KC345 TaxID=2530371 RepID=UPI00104B0310|nr:hypothetical protein [Actinomadura sp. KC345]TDC44834.1 hypothetical protein E1281_32475 [Actinomadura sp. KC345]